MINNLKSILKNKEFIIITVTTIQFIMFIPNNINLKDKYNDTEILQSSDIKPFNHINNELKKIENLKIIKMEQNDVKWNIKVVIEGDKEKIISSIEKMEEYDIINYNISGNPHELIITLDLNR